MCPRPLLPLDDEALTRLYSGAFPCFMIRHILRTPARNIAAAAAVTALLAACGTTATTQATSTSNDAHGFSQGATARTIAIGFIALSPASVSQTDQQFGATPNGPGSAKSIINAIAGYVNAHGGIAGRKIVPYVVYRSTSSNNPSEGLGLCASLTQDHHVFAAITNEFDDSATPGADAACYARAHTLYLADTSVPDKFLSLYAPYVWSPGQPSVNGGYRTMTRALIGEGFFNHGTRLGILAFNDPADVTAYQTVVAPGLATIGYRPTDVRYTLDPTTTSQESQWAAQLQSTVLRFKSEKINRVIFMEPGGGAPLLFMRAAQSQGYHPVYGLSSYDDPGFVLEKSVPSSQLTGAEGAGWNEVADMDSVHGDPFPTGPAETQCLHVLKATGAAPTTRSTFYQAEFFCDGVFLLSAAAAHLGKNLNTATLTDAIDKLGRSYQAAYGLPNGTYYGPGSRSGGAYYRDLAFKTSCKCFEYTSGNKRMP